MFLNRQAQKYAFYAIVPSFNKTERDQPVFAKESEQTVLLV